jgi:hypothetical protein
MVARATFTDARGAVKATDAPAHPQRGAAETESRFGLCRATGDGGSRKESRRRGAESFREE